MASCAVLEWNRAGVRELGAQISRAVDSLAPEYRVVLVLREIDSLSYTEIAEVTGLTLEAVKPAENEKSSDNREPPDIKGLLNETFTSGQPGVGSADRWHAVDKKVSAGQ